MSQRTLVAILMLSMLLLGVVVTPSGPSRASGSTAVTWPLAADGRRLVDQVGRDFLIYGDAAWSLFAETTPADVELYLDDRQARGFNTLMVWLVVAIYASPPPLNNDGDSPWGTNAPEAFVTYDDPTAEPYWSYVDDVVQAAKDRDMLLLIAPAYVGFGCVNGWSNTLNQTSIADLTAYGEWIGARYASFRNVLWVNGGDVNANNCGAMPEVEAVRNGIETAWPEALHTAHSGREVTGRDVYSSIIDVDTSYDLCKGTQSGFPAQIKSIYEEPAPLPFFAIEGYYDGRVPDISDTCLRSQLWWPMLGGGLGTVMGHESVWCFLGANGDDCALFPTTPPWESNLPSPPALGMTVLRDLFDTFDASLLVPDYDHSVVTGGFGSLSNASYVGAASSPTKVIAYTPDQRQLTVDFSSIGPVNAEWIRAADGTVTPIGVLSGSGNTLTPPSSGDWILNATSTAVATVPALSSWGVLGAVTMMALSRVAGSRRRLRALR